MTYDEITLKEFIAQKTEHIETTLKLEVKRLDRAISDLSELQKERRETDLHAVEVAKTSSDAALQQHNELIKQMRQQAAEAQRQLDKLTDTYATKENLKTLELLIDVRLSSIDTRLQGMEVSATSYGTEKRAVRMTLSDMKSMILLTVVVLGFLIALSTYLAQN